MAGDISLQHKQLFRDFLDVCQLRGRDSTGVIKVSSKLEYDWAKRVGPPSELCDTRAYDRMMVGDTRVLIGHTRSKTMGEISNKNAHPFDYPKEGICGVHNGTLRNYSRLDGYEYSKVDSDVLYSHLAQNGPAETFDRLDGAFACVWWDANEKTLNFIRNKERPLWFTWTKDKKIMLWASERWMFSAISRKVELWDGEKEEDGAEKISPYYELPTETHWRFRPGEKIEKDRPPLTLLPVSKIEKAATTQVSVQPGSGNNRHGTWVEKEDGTWSRLEETQAGGEVVDPFLSARNTLLARLMAEGLEDLDDDLPWDDFDLAMARDSQKKAREEMWAKDENGRDMSDLKPKEADTPPEETSLPISNVAFLNSSLTRAASSPASTDTQRSKKKTLSLPETNFRGCPSSNNGKPSSGSDLLSQRLKRVNAGVSFRTICGIDYITNNVTGQEWTEVDFAHQTGGKCAHCKTPVGSLREVATILSKDSFICKSCLKQPAVA